MPRTSEGETASLIKHLISPGPRTCSSEINSRNMPTDRLEFDPKLTANEGDEDFGEAIKLALNYHHYHMTEN